MITRVETELETDGRVSNRQTAERRSEYSRLRFHTLCDKETGITVSSYGRCSPRLYAAKPPAN